MSKAEQRALEAYPIVMSQYSDNCKEYDSNESDRLTFIEGYQQAEKDVTEAFARIIRSNLGGIGNSIQNMFEQLYTDIIGEKNVQRI